MASDYQRILRAWGRPAEMAGLLSGALRTAKDWTSVARLPSMLTSCKAPVEDGRGCPQLRHAALCGLTLRLATNCPPTHARTVHTKSVTVRDHRD